MSAEQPDIIRLADHQRKNRNTVITDILDAHECALRRFLRVRLRQNADQEDIIQEVFLRLSHMEDVETRFKERPETLRNYLFSVATNLIRDKIRRATVRQSHSHEAYDDEQETGQSTTPEELLVVKQDISLMRKALAAVKQQHRDAFVMSRIKQMSYRQIASELGVSISTVEKYVSAALFALRKELT